MLLRISGADCVHRTAARTLRSGAPLAPIPRTSDMRPASYIVEGGPLSFLCATNCFIPKEFSQCASSGTLPMIRSKPDNSGG